MASIFPEIFRCAANQRALVLDYMERLGDKVVWDPIFRSNLNDEEETQFSAMLILIGNVYVPLEGKDRRIWIASRDGSFRSHLSSCHCLQMVS